MTLKRNHIKPYPPLKINPRLQALYDKLEICLDTVWLILLIIISTIMAVATIVISTLFKRDMNDTTIIDALCGEYRHCEQRLK
jgi:hypothetical protein